MSRVYRIERVVLAAPPPVCFVRCRHFQNRNAGMLKIAQQPRPLSPGAFNANALQRSK